jgi:hypothetical protein
MTTENVKELAPVGLFACLAHAFSVLALGAGAVSFGQIVKAGEPVFAAATNAILLKVKRLMDSRKKSQAIYLGHRSPRRLPFAHSHNWRRRISFS